MRAHVGSAPGRRDGAFESNCSDASSDEGMIRPEEEVENEDADEGEDVDEDEEADKDEEDCAIVSGRLPTRLGADLVADKDADKDDDADGMRSSTLRMCALVCAEYDGASCGRESSEDARR